MDKILRKKIADYFEKSIAISGNFDSGDPTMKESFVEDILENKIGGEIFELIKKVTPSIQNLKLLDMGCGLGGLISICQKNGIDALGIELDPEATQIAKERTNKENVVVDDCENMTLNDDSFDLVSSICVIEHVKDAKKYIKEAYRVLKKDGLFLIFAPNNFFPWEGHYKTFWLPYLLPYTKPLFKLYLKVKGRNPKFIDFVNLGVTPGYLKKTIKDCGFKKIKDLSIERFKERLYNPDLIADQKAKRALVKMRRSIFFKVLAGLLIPFLRITKLYHPIILIAQK